MTIKKTIKKTVVKTGGANASGAPAAGSATIADRYKLAPAAPAAAQAGGKGLVCAFVAAILSLIVSGVLVYILWDHWSFLGPA